MADADNLQPPTHNNQQESASDSVNLGLQLSVEGNIDKKNEFQLTAEQVYESTFARGMEFKSPTPLARKLEYYETNIFLQKNIMSNIYANQTKFLICLLFSRFHF